MSRSALDQSPGFLPALALMAASSSSKDTGLPSLLERVRAVAPDSSLVPMVQAMIRSSQDDRAGAVAPLKVLAERHPDNRHLAYQYAQALGASDQDEQAVAALREITSSDGPYRLAASNDLAYMLTKQGGTGLEEAAELARSVLKAIPDSPVVMDTAGWVEHQRGRDKAALKLLSAAITSLKDEPEAHYHLGATYLALGQTSWARYHLTEAAAGDASQSGVQQAKELLKQMGDATGWQ
jgi:predicted Zn-dependent protease